MSLMPRRPVIQLYQLASGRRLLSRLDELNRTQWLSRGELQSLQRRKLHRLLEHAREHVPYYRQLFDSCGFEPDEVLTSLEGFRRLPILTKEIIRQHQDELLTTDKARRAGLSELTTSGSTGHPLIFYQDSNFRDYVTADIHRHLGWAGWRLGEVHSYVWGLPIGEVAAPERIRTGLMNWALNRFVTDAYHLSDESMAGFAREVRRHHPRIIFGYPSSLYRLAQFARERNLSDLQFEAIFTSAEMIFLEQRRILEEAFGGRVFNRYGSRELGGISCECAMHTGMHVSSDTNLVEILKDGRQAGPGEVGDVIVTNLNNFGMPFIRYAIEDLGAWSEQDSCPCGRAMPMMGLTQARRLDTFWTSDGHPIWGAVDSHLFGMRGVKQFQTVQKSTRLVIMRIVKEVGTELEPAKLDATALALKGMLGSDVEVRFEFPDEIPVLPSGKHRYAISEVRDQREVPLS